MEVGILEKSSRLRRARVSLDMLHSSWARLREARRIAGRAWQRSARFGWRARSIGLPVPLFAGRLKTHDYGYCVGQRSATRGRQTEHAGFPEAGGEPSGVSSVRRDLPGQEQAEESVA